MDANQVRAIQWNLITRGRLLPQVYTIIRSIRGKFNCCLSGWQGQQGSSVTGMLRELTDQSATAKGDKSMTRTLLDRVASALWSSREPQWLDHDGIAGELSD